MLTIVFGSPLRHGEREREREREGEMLVSMTNNHDFHNMNR